MYRLWSTRQPFLTDLLDISYLNYFPRPCTCILVVELSFVPSKASIVHGSMAMWTIFWLLCHCMAHVEFYVSR